MGSHYVCTMVPIIIIPSCSDIAYVSINPPGVTAIVFDYNQPNNISFIYEGFSPPEVVQGFRVFRGDDFTRDSDNDQLYSLLLSGFTFDDGIYVMRSMDQSKCTYMCRTLDLPVFRTLELPVFRTLELPVFTRSPILIFRYVFTVSPCISTGVIQSVIDLRSENNLTLCL